MAVFSCLFFNKKIYFHLFSTFFKLFSFVTISSLISYNLRKEILKVFYSFFW